MDPDFQKFLQEQRGLDETAIANLIDEKVCHTLKVDVTNWKG